MAKKELKQTKGTFVMKGIVDGLSNDRAYNEGTVGSGKSAGKDYKSIRFGVQTSKTNKLTVELFGMEQDYVFAYKHGKKGAKGDTKRIDFEDRHDDLPNGYNLIGINMGLEQNEAGKNVRTTLAAFDAVEYIYDNLDDGDSVKISGNLVFSVYNDEPQIKYEINSIYKEKNPIDFDAEDFEEVAGFTQEIVFIGAEPNKEEKTMDINAYTIQYGNKFTVAQFVVRPDGDKDLEGLAKAMKKLLKFGDVITVEGNCLNNAVVTEIAEVKTTAKSFGGKRPKGVARETVTNWVTELQITYADDSTHQQGVYSEDDFIDDELIEDEDEDDSDDTPKFGGKKRQDEEDSEEEDDDLPF